MALRNRSRPQLVESNALFESITDLQRLDGLSSLQRPKEPPPPPPSPPSEPKQDTKQRPLTPPQSPYTDREVQCILLQNNEDNKHSNTLNITEIEQKQININLAKEFDKDIDNNPNNIHLVNGFTNDNIDSFVENSNLNTKVEQNNITLLNGCTQDYKDKENITSVNKFVKDNSEPPIVPPRKRSAGKFTTTKRINSDEQPETNKTENELIKNENYAATHYQKFRIHNENVIGPQQTEKVSIVNSFQKEHTIKTEPSKTIVQITPTKIIPSTIHRLQIHNESPDNCISFPSDIPQRKTSILINGDDCYSTVNVNDDIPLYQSSVVVNDNNTNNIEVSYKGARSSVYITGNFDSSPDNSFNEDKKTLVVVNNVCHTRNLSELSDNSLKDVEIRSKNVEIENKMEEKSLIEKKNAKNNTLKVEEKASSDELQKLLNDPVEAVKRNLVPHVCGKADIDGKSKRTLNSNSLVARLLEDPFLGSLTEGLQNDTVAKLIENSLLKLHDLQNCNDDEKDICSDNDSCPPYELIEAGSDCYSNHSNRSSVAEDDLSTRSKFYQLLSDTAITEIEEHHYECIKPNNDPIYEEIEIPPPLPSNPPPSNLTDDLQIDKQFTTR